MLFDIATDVSLKIALTFGRAFYIVKKQGIPCKRTGLRGIFHIYKQI